MSEVQIKVVDNGPLLIQQSDGQAIEVFDADGNKFQSDPAKPSIALCRCGVSNNRPFCDGSHKSCGFEANERAAE